MRKWFEDRWSTLTQSTGVITLPASSLSIASLTIGGKQYHLTSNLTVSVGTVSTETLYFVYAVISGGTVSLVISLNQNSVGPNGYTAWKLVGAFYGNFSSTFGSFVTIKGVPTSGWFSHTPAPITGVTLSSSDCLARVIGKMRYFQLRFAVTGNPVAIVVVQLTPSIATVLPGAYGRLGSAHLSISGGNQYQGSLSVNNTSQLLFGGSGTAYWDANVPVAWTNASFVQASYEYDVNGQSVTPLEDL